MPEGLWLSTATTGALSPDMKAQIVSLCSDAFGEDFSSLFDFVQTADHVLATIEGRLVGHAVWATRHLEPSGWPVLRTAYVDAVATAPELWHQGIGRAVMDRVVRETNGFQLRALSTDEPGFYQRLGWKRWIGPLAVRRGGEVSPTPGETVFVLATETTPRLDLNARLIADDRGGQPW